MIAKTSAQVTVAASAQSTSSRSHAGRLLRQIAADARTSELPASPPPLIEKLVAAGLGPILLRVTETDPDAALGDLLLSADLTARLLMGYNSDATEEILRAAGPAATEVVLLKGIAAAQLHYPEPHLRLMGDIDLLAPPGVHADLHRVLRELGYVQRSDLPSAFYETHHHAMPFFHPEKQLWVELHRAFFPKSWSCATEPCFAVESAISEAVPMLFRGIQTRRLRDETHLIYTCTHWAGSFNLERGMLGIVDVIYLLTRGTPLDWDTVLRKAPNGWSRRSLGLMLGYLAGHAVIDLDKSVAALVADVRAAVGRANTGILYRLIDDQIVSQRTGRFMTEANARIIWRGLLLNERLPYINLLHLPLALLFPPGRPDRFNPILVARRVRSLLRRAGESQIPPPQ